MFQIVIYNDKDKYIKARDYESMPIDKINVFTLSKYLQINHLIYFLGNIKNCNIHESKLQTDEPRTFMNLSQLLINDCKILIQSKKLKN